jgi:hypothetical protein
MHPLTPSQLDGSELVNAEVVGAFLNLPTKSVMRLAQANKIPHYCIPSAQGNGHKHFRKFSIPEVKTALHRG